jgi:hypothetical protein
VDIQERWIGGQRNGNFMSESRGEDAYVVNVTSIPCLHISEETGTRMSGAR